MNRHNGARSTGNDRFLHSRWVEQQGLAIYIDERDPESAIKCSGGASNEGKVRNDNLAAIVEAVMIKKRGEGDAQRVGAVRQQKAVSATTVRCPLPGKFPAHFLRQTFDAAKKKSTKRDADVAVPEKRSVI